jgi:hypothetical protein
MFAKRTYIVVELTVPEVGVRVWVAAYPVVPDGVLEISKPFGAEITRLSVRLLPDTVKLVKELAVP